jgi:hypothetical protein
MDVDCLNRRRAVEARDVALRVVETHELMDFGNRVERRVDSDLHIC